VAFTIVCTTDIYVAQKLLARTVVDNCTTIVRSTMDIRHVIAQVVGWENPDPNHNMAETN
jgi:hypothetical protein